VKLLVGEHAATRLPETGNWSVYDLVISSFPPTLDWFRSKGVPAELSRLAFEPRVLSHLKKMENERLLVSHAMFREGLTRPLASVIVPDCPLQAIELSNPRRVPAMSCTLMPGGQARIRSTITLLRCLCAMHFAQLSPRPPIGSSKDFYVTAFA
jgi:hypothetical protein